MKNLVILLATFTILSCKDKPNRDSSKKSDDTIQKPNIVLLYIDDLGYADVGAYGAKGVKTPNVDILASKGVMFTDAHSSAATCTLRGIRF